MNLETQGGALLERIRSASGLRPATAFVLIAAVMALVAGRTWTLALAAPGEQPRNLTVLDSPRAAFDLAAADGTPLAFSVEYLELVASPNALWQAHTPGALARKLALALGPTCDEQALLERLLPDAQEGWIVTSRDPLLLDRAQAERALEWLRRGSLRAASEEELPVRGVRLVETAQEGRWALAWAPQVLLSEAERARFGLARPLDFTRRLADELALVVWGDQAAALTATDEQRTAMRTRLWGALMPSRFKSVVKEVPVERAQALFALLKDERVGAHQMELKRHAKRMYPAKGEALESPPLAVLGRWGTLDPASARRAAIRELGLTADESAWSDVERDWVLSLTEQRVYQPSPMSGLELLASNLLTPARFPDLDLRGEQYYFLANQAPRQPLQRYFRELVPGSETPQVVTTLEIGLQRQLRAALERCFDDHQPAAAMALAIDVGTGDVLAVDAIDPYGMGGFLPTLHTFTPGSTMKVLIMAAALEAGVVRPQERINSFNGHFSIGGRAIGEAEGGTDRGVVTAAEGLAYSLNAVLVQIGTRVPPETLRQNLLDLGYARYPGSGMGGERCGTLPSERPWKTAWAHASVSFGHELHTTLWQHAAALATVVRGGEYRPLRLVQAVEQAGRRWELPLAEPRRVFREHTALQVREMMELGARIGTGRNLKRQEILLGSKTGTAQKMANELCLHVELQHNQQHGCRGARECRAALKGQKAHSRLCYTSSIMVYGRLPEGGREVMVLVVVDEPRGARKYGSEVAGPAAMAILHEALGRTRGGEAPMAVPADGLHPIALDERGLGLTDQPWGEAQHAAR